MRKESDSIGSIEQGKSLSGSFQPNGFSVQQVCPDKALSIFRENVFVNSIFWLLTHLTCGRYQRSSYANNFESLLTTRSLLARLELVDLEYG